MLALKFLKADGASPQRGFVWPLPRKTKAGRWIPGKWVTTSGDLIACKNGVHACLPDQMRKWKSDRLFVIELDGVVESAFETDKIVARRGRLLREVEAWWIQRRGSADPDEVAEIAIACKTPSQVPWKEAVRWLAKFTLRPPAIVCTTSMLCRAVEPVAREAAAPLLPEHLEALLEEVAA